MNELTDGQIDALLVLHGKGDDGFHSFARGAIAADRALQASRVAVPATDGWVLVPLEPTAEMLQAGQDAPVSESDEDAPEDYKAVYRAMLAAAPHPQQIAGLEKDAEIAALKAERDALLKNDARYRFVVSSTDHSMAKWHDCEGWYAIEEADLDADMQAQGVKS